jgi:molybdopterin molybdotransferase
VSAGKFDFVPATLRNMGVQEVFHKVKQKPGKPIWAGRVGNIIVFALPGNPASVITCANQYVMPVLKKMAGFQDVFEPDARLPLRQDYHKKAGLTQILKVQVAEGQVEVLGGQESFNLLPFAEANALAVIPENTELALAGTKADVFYL